MPGYKKKIQQVGSGRNLVVPQLRQLLINIIPEHVDLFIRQQDFLGGPGVPVDKGVQAFSEHIPDLRPHGKIIVVLSPLLFFGQHLHPAGHVDRLVRYSFQIVIDFNANPQKTQVTGHRLS